MGPEWIVERVLSVSNSEAVLVQNMDLVEGVVDGWHQV